ncbi:hypothetical protein B0A58_13510 [Flavobacterium branchiophilum NBRC 15030 = ATCC 35035]|uniref:Uncharacterized protein n=1 Tax=Flavobacterium branchiophilum TaxID=55197 RepID=A0A543G616_9FLAO|nr:hypothetical protein [Flavobacterium branchiophilum]OXA71678.1 hypothetical protein B0A58_13510 [Flavobacterium branchiophilum NBRC 15030 = ATCC 35035]TQM41517.1 hypothetical protein BC670_2494 [Flavobacterium branchiophilum]GEM55959.1 hypothetical protein FB1_21800 [Flavobacterium branchiophilum NBRC 15030 = ATCC 35035]
MSIDKEKIELRNSITDLNYNVSISRNNEISVHYTDNDTTEIFSDFYVFLDDLAKYYNNRISDFDEIEDKIYLCDAFLYEIQEYRVGSFPKLIEDKEKFAQEIELRKEQFISYKQRFEKKLNTQISKTNTVNNLYSTKQQVLILEYLGVLKLFDFNSNEKQKAKIISAIIGKDETNTVRAIRNMAKVVEKGSENTKTKMNLETVRDLFKENNLLEIANKIQEEINTIKKG